MKKIKISELPLCESLRGVFTIGTNSKNESVKVPLDLVEQATERANQATNDIKSAFESLINYTEDVYSYGIEFDVTVSSPTCQRIGNSDLHRRLPVQSRMKGCLLDDDGNVVEYLNPTDWTGNVLDGSRGQVMVEIPEHYRKFETDGNKRRVLISELPLSGYALVPRQYVSAYQASLQRSTNKLSSVKNTSPDFRGGDNDPSGDGTYRSLLGLPVTSLNRTALRNYARNRKSGSTEWNIYTYELHKTIFWLFVTEYATLNSQETYNAAPSIEGFKQGGLGEGVTTWNRQIWSEYNYHKTLIPCGVTDNIGNLTGIVSYSLLEIDNSVVKTFSVPRYRGIENPFGHLWQWVDGINVRISTSVSQGGNGKSQVFVCSDPSKFNDINYDGYRLVGEAARRAGYVREIFFGDGGEIIAKTVGGGSTNYFCDYHHTVIPSSGEELRSVLFGGCADNGAIAGLATANSGSIPSHESLNFGSRLCFIPRQQ